jgi:hypothetical protein
MNPAASHAFQVVSWIAVSLGVASAVLVALDIPLYPDELVGGMKRA